LPRIEENENLLHIFKPFQMEFKCFALSGLLLSLFAFLTGFSTCQAQSNGLDSALESSLLPINPLLTPAPGCPISEPLRTSDPPLLNLAASGFLENSVLNLSVLLATKYKAVSIRHRGASNITFCSLMRNSTTADEADEEGGGLSSAWSQPHPFSPAQATTCFNEVNFQAAWSDVASKCGILQLPGMQLALTANSGIVFTQSWILAQGELIVTLLEYLPRVQGQALNRTVIRHVGSFD
jgi:hypothetical protein